MKTGLSWTWCGAALCGFVLAAQMLPGCLELEVQPEDDGTGGTGGAPISCVPGEAAECNTGFPDNCAIGKGICNEDGKSVRVCTSANPRFDDCVTPADEDCDGNAISACSGDPAWSLIDGKLMDDSLFGAAALPTGGFVATGVIEGKIDGGTSVSAGQMYLARLNDPSAPNWYLNFPASGMAVGRAVAADALGNIVLAGDFAGSMNIEGENVNSNGMSRDILLAKFDGNGKLSWIKGVGDTGIDVAVAVAIDSAGDIVSTGRVRGGVINFGGGGTQADLDDVFLVKFDSVGKHLWSKVFVNNSDQQGRGLALTPDGDVILVGDTSGNVNFGCMDHGATSGADIFVARFASGTGHCVWSRLFTGADDQLVRGVAIGANGNPIITGRFSNELDFGGNQFLAQGPTDAFVAELDVNTGDYLRGRSFGNKTTSSQAIAVDGAGHVYLTGYFDGAIAIGSGTPIIATLEFDAFAIKFDVNTWEPLWMRSFGNAGTQYGFALAVDGQGQALVGGGFFNELVTTQNDGMKSSGGEDLFAVRLAP